MNPSMIKGHFYVHLILDSPQCTMISPWNEYNREKVGMPERKKWNPDNLIKLEDMVSRTMRLRNQKELLETLDKKILSLYIDCRNKWEDDIMLFIFKEYIKQSQANNKNNIVSDAIWRHTIITKSKEQWDTYIKENNLTLNGILQYYSESLKTLLQENTDEEWRNRLLNFECNIAFNGLGRLMEDEWHKYMTLYLDKVQLLTIEEQQRINMLLFTRWSIPQDRWIRLKINDGQWSRKTRKTMSGHRTEATHDYSEITIRENELE